MDPNLTHCQAPEALRDLIALNARFIHNFVTNDVPSHDAILHPQFIYISSEGRRVERAAYLEQWATGFDPEVIPYWDVRDEVISIVGSVALVRSTNKYVQRHGGEETTGMACYTDTYLCENGDWKCIQAQITSVSPENWPTDDSIVSIYVNGIQKEIHGCTPEYNPLVDV